MDRRVHAAGTYVAGVSMDDEQQLMVAIALQLPFWKDSWKLQFYRPRELISISTRTLAAEGVQLDYVTWST